MRAYGKLAASFVVKGAASLERLLDETSLFLHTIEENLPPRQRQVMRDLHDPAGTLIGKKVLLVDDDERNTFALSSELEEHGLAVQIAENGQAALDLLAEMAAVDLILMDIMMPVMDGYEAMRRIRKQTRFTETPIVALTAKAMAEDRAKCIEAGASDYMSKPVDMKKLVSMIHVLLHA